NEVAATVSVGKSKKNVHQLPNSTCRHKTKWRAAFERYIEKSVRLVMNPDVQSNASEAWHERPVIRRSHAPQTSGLYRGGYRHARVGCWREHGNLQRRQGGAA